MLVAGVDGCPRGWIVVTAQDGSSLTLLGLFIAGTFAEVLRRTTECDAVGIDIPIGLSDGPPRTADAEARRLIGSRRSSVFPAPVRPALGSTSYDEARALAAQASGRKMSKQAFAIMPKIREADESMTPALQGRLIEVHPEVSFLALAGSPLSHPKKKSEGEAERLRLVRNAFANDVASFGVPRGAARDDFYDACAAAWTAARFARGEHGTLPADPPRDARGLRMEIVY